MQRKMYRNAAGLVLLIVSPAVAEEPSPTVASYRSTITAEELEQWREATKERVPLEREVVLRELILTRSMAEEALRLGLDRKPEVQLQLELSDAKLSTTALRRDVNDSVQITDEQAEATYQRIKDTYTQPRRVRLYNLFKRYPIDATDTDRQAVLAKMEQLRKRLVAGEDFGELAEQESDSQSRFRKGLLGNVPAGTFPPQIDRVAMAMQPGEISEILYGTDGLTILYCEKILDKVVRTPENLRQIARNLLQNRTAKQAWADLQASLKDEIGLVFHWQALDADVLDPNQTLAEHADGRLTVADAERLLRTGRRPLQLSRTPQRQLHQRIEKYLLGKMNTREAQRRGLYEDKGLVSRQASARLKALADHTRIHLVQRDLEKPTEDEIREFFEANRNEFTRPTLYDLAAIRLPLPGEDERPIYQLGERIVHSLRQGELSFEDAARRHSKHPTAQTGGHMGPISRWVLPHRFGFNVLRAVLALQPGEMTDVVAEGENLWILQLKGVEESRPMTFDEARTAAENKLGTQRVRLLEAQAVEDWLAKIQLDTSPSSM